MASKKSGFDIISCLRAIGGLLNAIARIFSIGKRSPRRTTTTRRRTSSRRTRYSKCGH